MNKPFEYPNFAVAYPNLYQKGLFRRLPKQLRYCWFTWKQKGQTQQLVKVINDDVNLVSLLHGYPKIAQPMFEGYISNTHTLSENTAMLIQDLRIAQSRFPTQFFDKQSLVIIELHDDFSIKFQLNPLSCLEGMWSMGLYQNDERVYLFTFSLGKQNKLIIGSIQGAIADDNRTLIKSTTKKMHGLRPQQLMIWLAMALADSLNIQIVEAIDDENHPRMNIRKKLRGKTIFEASYNEIWQAYGAEKQASGNWQLPPVVHKPIEEYPSKKRSMYRKRYAMLESIKEAMNIHLSKTA